MIEKVSGEFPNTQHAIDNVLGDFQGKGTRMNCGYTHNDEKTKTKEIQLQVTTNSASNRSQPCFQVALIQALKCDSQTEKAYFVGMGQTT